MKHILTIIASILSATLFAQSFSTQVTKRYCDANMHRAVTNSEAIVRQEVPVYVDMRISERNLVSTQYVDQAVAGLASTQYVDNAVSKAVPHNYETVSNRAMNAVQNDASYSTVYSRAMNSLQNDGTYAQKQWVNNLPVSTFTNDANYITEDQVQANRISDTKYSVGGFTNYTIYADGTSTNTEYTISYSSNIPYFTDANGNKLYYIGKSIEAMHESHGDITIFPFINVAEKKGIYEYIPGSSASDGSFVFIVRWCLSGSGYDIFSDYPNTKWGFCTVNSWDVCFDDLYNAIENGHALTLTSYPFSITSASDNLSNITKFTFVGNMYEAKTNRLQNAVSLKGYDVVKSGYIGEVITNVSTKVKNVVFTDTVTNVVSNIVAKTATATISVGTVTSGSTVSVVNSGTSKDAVFDFVLQKGDTGSAGPANTLTIGTVAKGTSASATITGTSPNQVLNLTLPKGDKGDKGDQGIQGEPGSIGNLFAVSDVSYDGVYTNSYMKRNVTDGTIHYPENYRMTVRASTSTSGKYLCYFDKNVFSGYEVFNNENLCPVYDMSYTSSIDGTYQQSMKLVMKNGKWCVFEKVLYPVDGSNVSAYRWWTSSFGFGYEGSFSAGGWSRSDVPSGDWRSSGISASISSSDETMYSRTPYPKSGVAEYLKSPLGTDVKYIKVLNGKYYMQTNCYLTVQIYGKTTVYNLNVNPTISYVNGVMEITLVPRTNLSGSLYATYKLKGDEIYLTQEYINKTSKWYQLISWPTTFTAESNWINISKTGDESVNFPFQTAIVFRDTTWYEVGSVSILP